MTDWARHSEWEQNDNVVKAYHTTVHPGIYYVTHDEGTYRLQYWPNKNKNIETVSLLDSYEDKDTALDALDDKITE